MAKKAVPVINKSKFAFTSIKDIVIPDYMFHPVSTGNKSLDKILSFKGGVINSQGIFLTGMPGAGKTTVACYIANGLRATTGRNPVLLQVEMTKAQLKYQLGKLKGLDEFIIMDSEGYPEGSNCRTAPDRFAENLEIFKEILDAVAELKASCLIVDSMQELASKMDGYNDAKSQKDLVRVLYDWAKKTTIPIILIGHCNKDGKYEGPSKLLRTVDTHISCLIDEDTGIRTIRCQGKNRMGGSLDPLEYSIKNDGVYLEDLSRESLQAMGKAVSRYDEDEDDDE